MIDFENLFRKNVNSGISGENNPGSAHVEDVDYTEIKGGNPGVSHEYDPCRISAAIDAANSLFNTVNDGVLKLSLTTIFIQGSRWADEHPSSGDYRSKKIILAALDFIFTEISNNPRFPIKALMALASAFSDGADWADKNPV